MKKIEKKSVTIGICAYNEAKNIKNLLDSIVAQQENDQFFIAKIVVVSDGSIDELEKSVIHYPDARVFVNYFPLREGKPVRMNYLIQHNDSDILVFLDGDIVLESNTTIQHLVKPLIHDQRVGLVGGRCQPLVAETFVEGAVNNYIDARIAVENLVDFSKTAYCIHGKIMAISRKLASEMILPFSILSDDTYFYLFAKKRKYRIQYAKNAVALYRSPQTILDTLRQGMRHHAGTPQLYNYFLRKDVDAAYRLPISILFRISFYQLISNPLGYVLLKCVNYIAQKEGLYRFRNMSVRWSMIRSSKVTRKGIV